MFKRHEPLTSRCIVILCFILDLLTSTHGITTTHYDKPHHSIGSIQKPKAEFKNLTQSERQKRLLPYINFYVTQNSQQPQNDDYYNIDERYQIINIGKPVVGKISAQSVIGNKFGDLIETTYEPRKVYEPQDAGSSKTKYTPFLETNALPGPFVPMIRPQVHKIRVAYTPLNHREKVPNYSAIYDKLSQMKYQENAYEPRPYYQTQKTPLQYIPRKSPINYIPLREYEQTANPLKTYVHTYTPTSIDVPIREEHFHHSYEDHNQVLPQEENRESTPEVVYPTKLSNLNPAAINTNIRQYPKQNYVPVITLSQLHHPLQKQKQYHTQNHKQYLQEVTPSTNPILVIPQKLYQPILINNRIKSKRPILTPTTPTYVTETVQSQFDAIPAPVESTTIASNIHVEDQDSPNSLSHILKTLQDTNVLPHTLTPDNVDNSIKTLINILNSYKKGQKFSGPIVVEDSESDVHDNIHEDENPSTTVSQMFPANTPEGGTPGRPGIDYPALSSIPPTNFDCQTQRYKGFFADPETNCQVWHYCDLNGGQASFLCPNGTIFSQVALTCDWWFNVKCSTTTQLYVLNERLYKYIIPLKPKFPEDYAGPLVDKYLALKFKEMEEKLKKEKKEKENDKNKSDEIDELQLLEDQNQESQGHIKEPYTSHT